MQVHVHTLTELGWDAWFDKKASATCIPINNVARVVAMDRDQLMLMGEDIPYKAILSGKLIHESRLSGDFPCIGDWVCVDRSHSETGLVQRVLTRKTFLRRKTVGEKSGFQMIAANLDTVIVVQDCDYDFNLKRLERYLVMVSEGGAKPFILLSKTDLVSPEILSDQIAQIRNAGITVPVATLSNVTNQGVVELKKLFLPGNTYCFVGSSGVGKSTIINKLLGTDELETKTVSETGEGRHTTVRRELFILENGAMVIDNPGMREFGILDADIGLVANYADIFEIAERCRFRDCSHTNEPGCAVLEAVETGRIAHAHYDNFVKLRNESRYNQLTYAEKRKKDKDFGRFVKNAKKEFHKK